MLNEIKMNQRSLFWSQSLIFIKMVIIFAPDHLLLSLSEYTVVVKPLESRADYSSYLERFYVSSRNSFSRSTFIPLVSNDSR